MKELRELNQFLKPYTKVMLLGGVFLTGANFFLVWIPVLIRNTIDQVEQVINSTNESYDSLFEVLFSSEAGAVLAQNSLTLIGTVFLYGLLLFATRQTLIVTSRKVEFDIRNVILKKLMSLPQRFYSKYSTGEVYVRATEDVNKVREYYGPVIMYTINTVTRAGFVIFMMFVVNKELMFWALLTLPPLSLFAYWITGFIHKHSVIIQEQYSVLAGKAQETFSSIRLIKAFNREDFEQEKFEKESEEYRKKKLRLDLIESLFHPTLNLFIGFSLIVVVWKGGQMAMAGSTTIGNIAEFLIYVAYLIWPVAALGYTLNRFQKSVASWQRIREILQEPEEQLLDSPASELLTSKKEIKGHIRFENVSFIYPESSIPVLENISFEIEPGKTVALVGRTGAGKTSLVQLLPKLYHPTSGTIYLDGKSIDEYEVDMLRNSIGFVPQDTFLFSDTIEANISFGNSQASFEDVETAAEKAQVLENILEFEKKFKTILGERGITLSGGQKQRTSIARALLKNPKVLILDDALSAVDTKTEDAILAHLHEGFKDVTTIMISHRISTVKHADMILYIEDGRIVEQGTHEQLLQRKGYYCSMHTKQLLEQELEAI